nr:reverse transcriptase domain-containing protein [Tanacetum cinerariifolium]
MRNFIQNFQNGPPGEDKEHEATTNTELLSTEDIHPLAVQEPPNMEKTMLDLVKICHHKQFLCIHDDVDNLIESALDYKLLSINFINSQHLDKKEQEIKNVEEQPAERRNHAEKLLQNFKVIHKSSISFNTSQISSVHAVTPILSAKEPENSLSMGYEHLSITPETASDEVIESNAESFLPIPSECEVALEDKRECDLLISENSLVCDNSDTFFDSKIDDDNSVYDDDFENIEFVEGFSKIAKPLTKLTQKDKKYIWEGDQESAFQLLKQKLCEAPILALPEGNDDFVVYCDLSLQVFTDHKSLQHILHQKELNMRKRYWLELLADYDCEIRYHHGKAMS